MANSGLRSSAQLYPKEEEDLINDIAVMTVGTTTGDVEAEKKLVRDALHQLYQRRRLRIASLPWSEIAPELRSNDLTAPTPVGAYAIRPNSNGTFRLFIPGRPYNDAYVINTPEEGKEIAQKHFNDTIAMLVEITFQ